MADVSIQVEGLAELRARFAKMPERFQRGMRKAVEASLVVLQESAPPYPTPPSSSTYIRTGTLGRSLGVDMSGRKAGTPDIQKVENRGGFFVGTYGTRLNYAPYVIGEREQAPVHKGRWWTLLTVAQRAVPKITKAFQAFAEELARFLDKG